MPESVPPSFRHRRRQRTLARRDLLALGLGAAGSAAVAGGLTGFAGNRSALAAQETGGSGGPNPWQEPPIVLSVNGVLDVTFDAAPLQAEGLGAMAYSGTTPGPTLRFRPGDTVRVKLINNLGGKVTNLHVHGLHVSPSGNSDNVFQMLEPGVSFQYEYQIPANHPAGNYWYHPHHHGDATSQVNGGLAGMMVVEGALDDLPGIAELPERLFGLQGPYFRGNDIAYTVNGVENPEIPFRPGQTQRWRLANLSANNYFNLALEGHQFHVIGLDGNPLTVTQVQDGVLLGPGERAQVLIQAGEPGTYLLQSLPWGERGQAQPLFTVGTMVVGGEPMEAQPLPTSLFPLTDLSVASIAQQRIITFQENYDRLPFAINGTAFDPNVVNTTVKLGTTEEWILRNTSDEWHPFHIHVEDFQVMSVNGAPFPYLNRQDTVNLPPHGSVVVRIPFLDFPGKFVYHCHILAHEDFGMMSVIEVVP